MRYLQSRRWVTSHSASMLRALFLTCITGIACAGAKANDPLGINEDSVSRAEYFSWINNTNEGPSEAQTLTNLEFFAWLQKRYGMQLDIYAFDAGTIDSKRWYGSTDSKQFARQFPRGFDPLYRRAQDLDIRLGVWGGPDGFGNTQEDAQKRASMMVKLCEDYNFALFKFDAVAGQLRDDKQTLFADMMRRCRDAAPDLILLNHRLNLGEMGTPHATTFLFEGAETYIDVHMVNTMTAPHHRAGALARGLPPNLTRLTEDHGVCLSSALDYWDDELVLQAFNRSLILSPQIYGNPWLLRDDEYPKLARIFNLARQHQKLLLKGKRLDEKRYGPSSVARGDGKSRLVTLRNLSWEPVSYTLQLDNDLGLEPTDSELELRTLHPSERIVGRYKYGAEVDIAVPPFRSTLILVGPAIEPGLEGIDYQVINTRERHPVEILLEGEPGTSTQVTPRQMRPIKALSLDDQEIQLDAAGGFSLAFGGEKLRTETHRFLGKLHPTPLPADAEALYEASIFAADNNALEVRELKRAGATRHKAVAAAREAFFSQTLFRERGLWDRQLFDNDSDTAFFRMGRWAYGWNEDPDPTVRGGAFRLDLGAVQTVDMIQLESRDEESLRPLKIGEGIIAQVSADLLNWQEVRFRAQKTMRIQLPDHTQHIRYLRVPEAPAWLSEVRAYNSNTELERGNWRASNLFADFNVMNFNKAWELSVSLEEIVEDAYLAVGIPGEHGNEAVYAAMRVDGQWVGAPDRAPSYVANTWELQVKPVSANYTYYLPLRPEWAGKTIDVVALGTHEAPQTVQAEVWLTRPNTPLATRRLRITYE